MRPVGVLMAGLAMGAPALAQTADADRAYQAELMADAQGRQSLLQDGRAFAPRIGGWFQFRYDWNHADSAPGPDDPEDDTIGFQNTRVKLAVSGNIINEDWGYYVQGSFGRDDGNFTLEDAWGSYRFASGWVGRWGQFKLPLLREENVSDTYQLAADRSATNSAFSQGRSQGVQMAWESDAWRFQGAFSDGIDTVNTDFNSTAEADFALTGRAEWKWAGDWVQFRDFTSWQNSMYAGMVGAAAHYQTGGDTGGPTSDVSLFEATVDVSMEGSGWNAFAAGILRWVDPEASGDIYDWGFIVQGGMFVAPRWEAFGRFELTIPDDERPGEQDVFPIITVGFNHYIVPESHAAKFTVDVQAFLERQDQSILPTSTLTGLLPDTGDPQYNVRFQLQLVF